jgi:hypothetical protein
VNTCGLLVISRRMARKSPEAARRPGHHHLDGAGQPLDLFQDVRAEQDRPAFAAELVEQVHHVQPLPRVHPVEGLVEQQDLRVVHQAAATLIRWRMPLE